MDLVEDRMGKKYDIDPALAGDFANEFSSFIARKTVNGPIGANLRLRSRGKVPKGYEFVVDEDVVDGDGTRGARITFHLGQARELQEGEDPMQLRKDKSVVWCMQKAQPGDTIGVIAPYAELFISEDLDEAYIRTGVIPGHQIARGFERLDDIIRKYTTQTAATTTLFERLLDQNVPEIYAEVIARDFEDLAELHEEAPSKNRVYNLRDTQGRSIELKFIPKSRQKEAEMGHLVLKEFAEHPVLSQYVPELLNETLEEFPAGDESFYLVVQEDIRGKTARRSNEEWMKILAQVHVYGAEVMDKVDEYRNAHSMTRDKDEDRIESLIIDPTLRRDVVASNIDERTDFIHQDPAKNIIEGYLIDWDHAGRGNGLIDLVRMFYHPRILAKGGFSEDRQKRYLSVYLNERQRITGNSEPVSDQMVNTAYHELNGLALLYAQAQAGFLTVGKENPTRNDQCEAEMLIQREIPLLEMKVNNSLGTIRSYETKDAIVQQFPDLPYEQELLAA